MNKKYYIKRPTSRHESIDQAYQIANDLYALLRENVLKNDTFSCQEVCLFLDSFIRMRIDLNIASNSDIIDEERLSRQLISLYENSYKADVDRRFELEQLYSAHDFNSLVEHLFNERVLGKAIYVLEEEIRQRQYKFDNYDENDFDAIINYHNGISPNDCLDILAGYIIITEIEKLAIIRNKNVFYTAEIDHSFIACGTLEDIETLNHYDESDLFFSGVKEFKDVCCIWPFSNGYARTLRRDGRWGFLSQETNTIYWCDENVLYADDFRCERARIQLKDGFECYYFIDLCLRDCFHKRFIDACEFENGLALVSDTVCSNYRIDIYGNVHPDDIENYAKCRKESLACSKQSQKRFFRAKNKTTEPYDPETEIMDSLSGYGADPECYGF